MINQEAINKIITAGLKMETGCETVKTNTASTMPPYDYISFTIINMGSQPGTSAVKDYFTRQNIINETWSFTIHSDKDNNSMLLAQQAQDWFKERGRLYLSDYGIVVREVGVVTNRDNMLTVGYEYRNGFDVVLTMVNTVEVDTDTIDTFNIQKE